MWFPRWRRFGGIPVKLFDTAGIREGQGLVETLGIERSFQAMADADLTLVVVDLSAPPRRPTPDARAREQGRWILVGNKCDLPRRAEPLDALQPVSALTGDGIEALRDAMFRAVAPAGAGSWRRASSPACGMSGCCGNRWRIWKRRAPRWRPNDAARDAAAGSLRRAAAHRRHHRRHHRRRYPEPHFLDVLHRKVASLNFRRRTASASVERRSTEWGVPLRRCVTLQRRLVLRRGAGRCGGISSRMSILRHER
jgi:hypothetical protein